MRKLTSEERNKLIEMVGKLEKMDPSSSDAKSLKQEIDEITNEFANVSNKALNEKPIRKKEKQNRKVKSKHERQDDVNQNILDEARKSLDESETFVENLDEEELLDDDMFIETLKSVIKMNQACIDYSLVLLENASDSQAGRIKKCIDKNIENKRKLKSILKECIDLL